MKNGLVLGVSEASSGRCLLVKSRLIKRQSGLNFGSFSHSLDGRVSKGSLVYNLLSVSSVKVELSKKISCRLDSVIKPAMRCLHLGIGLNQSTLLPDVVQDSGGSF